MGVVSDIFDKVKTRFSNTSSTDIAQQDELSKALDKGKAITINTPKSERYTYLPGTAGKWLEKFKPQTQEEKDTLSPIGFFRQGERNTEKEKKIAERINAAASLM
jgi:hypothetical protein